MMRDHLQACRQHFVYVGIFSLFINLLMLTVPLFMLQVFDRVLTSRSWETLVALGLLATGALLVHLLLEVLRSRLLLASGVTLDSLAGPPVLVSLLENAVHPGNNGCASGLRDVAALRNFLSGGSIAALFDSPWVPAYVAVICLLHPWLGLIAAVGAMALFGLAGLNAMLSRHPIAEMQRCAGLAGKYVAASVRNAEIVHALGMVDALRTRWQNLHASVINEQIRAGNCASIASSLSKFARLFIQVVMLSVAAQLVIEQQMTAGVMIAATVLLARALAPVEAAIGSWKGLVEARDAYRRLDDMISSNRATKEPLTLPPPQGRLVLDRVVFALPGSNRPLIKGVSLGLMPGESLGIIGACGSGKSTLARLITGTWQANAGTVRLDGVDVAQWPRDQLGPHLGYLPQDVELFAGTVAENIARLTDPDDDAVITAAKRAHAHEMILRLPQGYDTVLAGGGAGLSVGQRQRIALARAIFGDPGLIVLDEPNANLDSEGEQALRLTIRGLRKAGATVLVVSHRTSLLADVDKLLVLQDGEVGRYGPRDQVLERLRQAQVHSVPPYVVHGGKR